MWEKEQSDALKEVFEALNENKIKWLVLRNYEGLPENNRSKDVDISIERKDFPKAKEIIVTTMNLRGFKYFQIVIFQYVLCLTFFKINDDKIISLKIDILDGGFIWRGAKLIDFRDIYESKTLYNNFYVPSPDMDGFMLWLKPLLTGGIIKDKYRSDILKTLEIYPTKFKKNLFNIFHKKLASKIWGMFLRGDIEKTVFLNNRLRYSAWIKTFTKQPIKTLLALFEHFYKELARRSKRPKVSFIAVLGPDGVGKSTFVELLKKELALCMIKEQYDVQVLHFRPNIFPNLKKLFYGKNYDESKENFNKPHREKPVKGFNALLRLAYYSIDYIIGYWFYIRKKCVAGQIFIMDRYFYDFIVDPFRSKIDLPKWIRLLFLKFIPEPDFVFILLCDAETIFKRKQELSIEEIKRQLKEYQSLANNSKKFVIINANQSVEKSVNDAIKHIIVSSFKKL